MEPATCQASSARASGATVPVQRTAPGASASGSAFTDGAAFGFVSLPGFLSTNLLAIVACSRGFGSMKAHPMAITYYVVVPLRAERGRRSCAAEAHQGTEQRSRLVLEQALPRRSMPAPSRSAGKAIRTLAKRCRNPGHLWRGRQEEAGGAIESVRAENAVWVGLRLKAVRWRIDLFIKFC